jgi:hypothetical protein
MKYWDIFTHTIKQWWNHKYLWIVGIIAAMFTGSGGSNNFSSFNNSSNSKNTSYQEMMSNMNDYLGDPAHLTGIIVVLVIILILGLGVFILGLYLRARADSALYQATQKLSTNDEKIGFWKTWGLGKYNLGKLVKQEILVSLPVLVIFILLGLVAVLSIPLAGTNGNMALLPLMCGIGGMICLIGVYAIFVSIATLFGRRMIVLENLDVIDGLKKGFNFFIKNFSHVLMFWLISMISGFVVFIVTFFIVIMVLFIGVAVVVALMFINPIIAIIVGIMAVLLFIVIIGLISGPAYTFSSMYWTNAYLEIKKYTKVNS